jgi:hypothetical protein
VPIIVDVRAVLAPRNVYPMYAGQVECKQTSYGDTGTPRVLTYVIWHILCWFKCIDVARDGKIIYIPALYTSEYMETIS